mmetsp:Transcript_12829/g.18700  ORF Transcript_12829/g.18700 Transcript_12829/m.18700 type:complete len:157 (-) Transcript_12829:17-487(-)
MIETIKYHRDKTVLMPSFVNPITRDLNRMLLEDVVLMKPQEKCIYDIAHDHVLLQSESMKCNVIKCIDCLRWKPKQLKNTWYFLLKLPCDRTLWEINSLLTHLIIKWERMRARMQEGRDIELEYRKHVYESVLKRLNNNNADEMDAVPEGFSRLLD